MKAVVRHAATTGSIVPILVSLTPTLICRLCGPRSREGKGSCSKWRRPMSCPEGLLGVALRTRGASRQWRPWCQALRRHASSRALEGRSGNVRRRSEPGWSWRLARSVGVKSSRQPYLGSRPSPTSPPRSRWRHRSWRRGMGRRGASMPFSSATHDATALRRRWRSPSTILSHPWD